MRSSLAIGIALLALLATASPRGHAQQLEQKTDIQVVFQTAPGGATVELLGMQSQVLGPSGTPLTLGIPRDRDTTLRFRFSLDGYRPETVDVDTRDLRGGSGPFMIPKDGPVELVPTSVLSPLKIFIARQATTLAAVALALVIAALLILPRQRRLLARFSLLRRLAVPKDSSDPNVGKVIQGWLLTKRLGAGGAATVYEAVPFETLDADRAIAVKIVHPEIVTAEYKRRFSREVNIGRSLTHPNLVHVMDWHDGDSLCIFMEMVKGKTLRQRMKPGGLPLDEALTLLEPVAKGLAYAHRKRIVHNDLKPGNVLVTEDGVVKVMDFGIATGQPFTRLTATGEAMGTPAYMAPEQFDGIRNDPRSDQYAFGIMAFEVLTGQRPFDDTDPMQCMTQHMIMTPPRVTDVRPDLPQPLADVINRMLGKTRGERYPDMDAAWDAFSRAARGEPAAGPQG